MSDEKFLEFKLAAQEEGATIGLIEPLVWDKEKTLRVTKHGAHTFAKVSAVKDVATLRAWIRWMWPN